MSMRLMWVLLDVVRAEGLNDSQAVRTALREAAARRRTRAALREEVHRLADDATDREEIAGSSSGTSPDGVGSVRPQQI